MTLGNIIKQFREKNGLSLREFAARCGMSHSYIAMLENEENTKTKQPMTPTLTTLQKIAKAMGRTIDSLIAEADDMLVDIAEKPKRDELNEYLEELRTRPEMRMLFSISKGATKEDIEKAVAIIEALRKTNG